MLFCPMPLASLFTRMWRFISLTISHLAFGTKLSTFLACSVIDITLLGLKCKVVASLLYADTLMEAKMSESEAEAPLLITYEGVEFSADDRPIKLFNGRSSCKLKISQVITTVYFGFLNLRIATL